MGGFYYLSYLNSSIASTLPVTTTNKNQGVQAMALKTIWTIFGEI